MDSGGGAAYPDSLDSSPRSRGGESWDEPFPSPSKLRVMVSYGGRIVPRPTDKSLCYLGGETRMVSIDRHSSLPDLASRLSRTLLGGRPFTLKYQLPNEDLDSLISVTADEDLDNLIDEYDRLSASGTKSQRIRLFLFPCKSESAPSSITTINSLLDDSKSETWFVDALNGALIEGGLPRGLSADAASVNTLLGLEDDSSVHSRGGGAAAPENGDPRLPRPESSGKIPVIPDSPMLDTTSSFGSASSVPYLPPIRVRPEDRAQIAGIEDQFGNMNVSGGVVATAGQEMLKEMGFAPQNSVPVSAAVVNPIVSPTVRESDDDKSDYGGVKKMQPVPVSSQQQKVAPVNAPIGSDPVTRPMYYQDRLAANVAAAAAIAPTVAAPTVAAPAVTTVAAPTVTTAPPANDPSYRGYLLPEQVQFQQQQYHQQQLQQQQQQQLQQQQLQQQQQQYTHYINPATGTVHPVPSMPSYYQMPHPIQQPHPYDQQMPMYYMPMRPSQPYNIAPMQPNLVDATAVAAPASTAAMRPNQPYNLAPLQPNLVDATIVASTATANPAKQAAAHLKAPAANPANLYRVAAPTAPGLAASGQQLIHVTPDQAQAYAGMGYQIMHHPHPQYAPQSAAPMANYGYEYAAADQSHQPQMYYNQATSPPSMAAQYQARESPSMAAQYQALSSAGATGTDTGLAPQPQLQTR